MHLSSDQLVVLDYTTRELGWPFERTASCLGHPVSDVMWAMLVLGHDLPELFELRLLERPGPEYDAEAAEIILRDDLSTLELYLEGFSPQAICVARLDLPWVEPPALKTLATSTESRRAYEFPASAHEMVDSGASLRQAWLSTVKDGEVTYPTFIAAARRAGVTSTQARKKKPEPTLVEIAEAIRTHGTHQAAAETFGVSTSTFSRWIRKYRS